MRLALRLSALLTMLLLAAPALADDAVSFKEQIAPILAKKCVGCHGQRDAKGGYQLFNFATLMKSGESGEPSVAAGKVDDSYLFYLINEDDKDIRMPKDGDKLPAEQIALVKKWIEQGAKFDAEDPQASLTSIVPKTAQPDPPEAYRVPIPVTALSFRPDGKELAAGGYHEITIWNPEDGSLLRRITNVAERTYGLSYNADGSRLAAASGTPGQLGEIKLFDPNSGELLKDLGTMPDVAFDVAFSPDGKRLAACGADRSIRIYDVESGSEQVLIEDHADWVMAIAWRPDGKQLASASRDKTSKVFDAETGDSQITYPGHGQPVYGVAWTGDAKNVISSAGDKQIHYWNPADGKKVNNIGGFGGEVYKLIVSGEMLFSCSSDKTARHHDVNKRNQVRSFGGHGDWVYAVTYSDAVKRLATGTYDGEIHIFNTEDGKEVLKFFAAPGYTPAEQASK